MPRDLWQLFARKQKFAKMFPTFEIIRGEGGVKNTLVRNIL